MVNLIIGIDLSFNSTGITISCFEDFKAKSIEFYRVMFDDEKALKAYKPTKLQNINNVVYKMPLIKASDILISDEDNNDIEQTEKTLQAIMCSKKISKILLDVIKKYNPENVCVCIENYIMPSFAGKNQLKHVSGLISLQAFVRKFILQLCIEKGIFLKLLFPTPSKNKKHFTGDGSADKGKMLTTFIDIYEGNKLIPQATLAELNKINDVVDSFSLMYYAYSKIINNSQSWQQQKF